MSDADMLMAELGLRGLVSHEAFIEAATKLDRAMDDKTFTSLDVEEILRQIDAVLYVDASGVVRLKLVGGGG